MSIGDVNSQERGSVLSASEAAWLAGFIDGEGSIAIRWQRSARDRHMTSTVATVCISQSEPRDHILDWLKEKFGGTVANHGTESRSKNHNASRRWAVTGAAAVAVCTEVMPYLRLKRRHAELLIEHQLTKLPSHIGCRKGMSPKSVRVSAEMVEIRSRHVDEIALLNKRGVHV